MGLIFSTSTRTLRYRPTSLTYQARIASARVIVSSRPATRRAGVVQHRSEIDALISLNYLAVAVEDDRRRHDEDRRPVRASVVRLAEASMGSRAAAAHEGPRVAGERRRTPAAACRAVRQLAASARVGLQDAPAVRGVLQGLMAYPAAGDELRQDWELLREFPPQPLAGLADGDRTWRTAEQIAEHRQGAAYCLEMETRVIAGKEYMGFDQWRREQLPIFVGLCC